MIGWGVTASARSFDSVANSNDKKCRYCGGLGTCHNTKGGIGDRYCEGTGKCNSCGGNGFFLGNSKDQVCPNCAVPGREEINSTTGKRYISKLSNGKCPTCKGTGKCTKCNGTGKEK